MGLINYISIQGVIKTPQNYGAIGDGLSHPLSGAYNSLSEAQAAYSFDIQGCSTTSSSTTVFVSSSTASIQAGYPVSGTGIPANTTVISVTDANHFVMSNAATVTGNVTITSSFVTSLTQEIDWAGFQAATYAVGTFYAPPGSYVFGSSTWRTTNPSNMAGQLGVLGDGLTFRGAGPKLTAIFSTGDAVHILGRYQAIYDMAFFGPADLSANIATSARGITLGEGNYSNNFHAIRVSFYNYKIGFDNPGDGGQASGWDGSSIVDCYFKNCQIAIHSYANQDWLGVENTTIDCDYQTIAISGASTTNGSSTVAVSSTASIPLGATVSGTNIPARSYVSSITDSTHFVLTENATGTGSGITINVDTIGIYVNGSGAVHWNRGVCAAPGMSVVNNSASFKSSGNHFEGCSQTYFYGFPNSGWIFEQPQFQDGHQSLVHMDAATSNTVLVTGASVSNPGLVYNAPGLMYIFTRGNVTALSPDHTAIEDYNGAMQVICGDYFIQGGDNGLPAPTAAYRGKRYYQGRYAFWSYPDAIFRCMDIGGSYAWLPEQFGAPTSYNLNASGATTDGTTTTIATIPIVTGATIMIEAKIQAHRTGGSSGTAEDSAGYDLRAVYKNVAGVATAVGKDSLINIEDQPTWNAATNESGSNCIIQVTGAANNSINWSAYVRVYTLT